MKMQPGFPPGRVEVAASAADCSSGPGAVETARILIVEDDYFVASELEATLIDAGFDVVGIAASAEEASALARAERPLLAIMDIRLVGPRDGVDAALELFRRDGIRSLFATAHQDPRTRERAAAASPLGWISKPYRAEAVIELIRLALASLRHPGD